VTGLKARLEKIIELTMTSFFASDLEKANEALDLQSTLVRDLHQLAASIGNDHRESKRSSSSNALSLVLRPIEHVSKYYGTIAQVTINRVLETPLRPRPAGREAAAPIEAAE